ncbi:MAG: DUF2970 domain-containing protein [Pseudomonadales bacterium]
MTEASDKTSENKQDGQGQSDQEKQPGLFQVTLSVMAAALGVQSEANRQRDFSQRSPLPYILGGLIFTVLFVLTIVGVVMLVLPD